MGFKNSAGTFFNAAAARASKNLEILKNLRISNMYLNSQLFGPKFTKEDINFIERKSPEMSEKTTEKPVKPSDIQKEKPSFQCSDCGSTFTKQSNLKLHIETIHEKKKPWLCSECGTSFGKQDGLKRHISIVHKGERPFSCSLCDRSFTEKGHLKKHIQAVHEHIRPYQCPYCEKKCNRKPQVVNHAKAKHKTKVVDKKLAKVAYCILQKQKLRQFGELLIYQ